MNCVWPKLPDNRQSMAGQERTLLFFSLTLPNRRRACMHACMYVCVESVTYLLVLGLCWCRLAVLLLCSLQLYPKQLDGSTYMQLVYATTCSRLLFLPKCFNTTLHCPYYTSQIRIPFFGYSCCCSLTMCLCYNNLLCIHASKMLQVY